MLVCGRTAMPRNDGLLQFCYQDRIFHSKHIWNSVLRYGWCALTTQNTLT